MRPISLALPVFLLALASALPARADFLPDTTGVTGFDRAAFAINQGGRVVGRETFTHFVRRDTIFSYSTVRLDGLAPDSPEPLERRTTFLQRTLGSYPLYFESITVERDTSQHLAVSCVFSDTTVIVYRERSELGRGEALALPPGRMYLFEPGVYHPVQLLLADFVDGTQQTRKQRVFVPQSQIFIDLTLTRGAKAPLHWGGKNVMTTKVGLTDGNIVFIGWLDDQRRLLRLEAMGQGFVIEREASAAGTPASTTKAKTTKGAAPKRSTPSTKG